MPSITAATFAGRMHHRFALGRRGVAPDVTAGRWSQHVFPLLCDVAEDHELWWAGGKTGRAGSQHGETREYLWDFTMYKRVRGAKPADTWGLPLVVVEHENSHSRSAFMYDHWKTLFSHARLRVAIGYVGRRMATKRGEWVEEINDLGRQSAWHFPRNSEDLIALGYEGMLASDNFEFWRRRRGQRAWKKLTVPAARE